MTTLPVSSLLADWPALVGPSVAKWLRAVAVEGNTVFLSASHPPTADDRSTLEGIVLRVFDSPTWTPRVTEVRWLRVRPGRCA
jgi:hypothetical protein